MKTTITVSFLLLFLSFIGFAQTKIGSPAGAPNASAILDLSNTGALATAKKGFLGPQVALSGTADATTVPTPATGLMVYNTTAAGSGTTAVVAGYYYYNGSQWVQMVSSTVPASGNIYTADGTLTSSRTLNGAGFKLNFNTKVGIGTSTPASQLEIPLSNAISSLTVDSAYIMLGQAAAVHTLFDFNTIQTKTNATTAGSLQINPLGGNVGVGTNPGAKLEVKGAGSAFPATSGTTQSAGLITRLRDGSTNGMLDIGGNTTNGSWLQATDASNLATTYPIMLNPIGGNVGIGTTAPNSTLQVAGSTALGYSELTASATLTSSNHFVNVNSASATTITLPVVTGILGREYIIRNTGTGTVSVVVTGSSTINAGTNSFATLTATAGQTYTLYAGSTNWQALLNVTNINTAGGAATLQSMILPAINQGISGAAITMGGAGSAINLNFDKAASNYANSITGADFNASNSQITLPAGIYQVIWNFVGLINFPANPSTLNLFWDVPDGAGSATHRVHYASGSSTTFNPYGITFVTTMQITTTRTFNFSLGVGSGNASTSFGVAADARLVFIKIQ